jgi:hypothetical protein
VAALALNDEVVLAGISLLPKGRSRPESAGREGLHQSIGAPV